jgi:hypothetical protein
LKHSIRAGQQTQIAHLLAALQAAIVGELSFETALQNLTVSRFPIGLNYYFTRPDLDAETMKSRMVEIKPNWYHFIDRQQTMATPRWPTP